MEKEKMTMSKRSKTKRSIVMLFSIVTIAWLLVQVPILFCNALSLSSFSRFHGSRVEPLPRQKLSREQDAAQQHLTTKQLHGASTWVMRKQKASDRRTRRMQRGAEELAQDLIRENLQQTITSSPMYLSEWQRNKKGIQPIKEKTGGRGRSRKRATLYSSLSSYHNKFLKLLTEEYKAEENDVLSRIKASLDDPLTLEVSGEAVFDLYPERRGNLFSDEVYRLTKANDASYVYNNLDHGDDSSDGDIRSGTRFLPPDHKFSNNDVILLTLQPRGSGDFFDPLNLPTSGTATSIEGRVISTGPTYIDVALAAGVFETAFGPAPNNQGQSGRGDRNLRLRADRFFSNIPYTRMVGALTQLTAIPDRSKESTPAKVGVKETQDESSRSNISMDELLKETIISTYSFTDPESLLFHEEEACDVQRLNQLLSKPPMPTSVKLANQALKYIQQNPHKIFNPMNGPQLAAIGAALTRKLTMIQGPPGTGKTTTASAIGFGFVHQCRSLSPNAKVLACAFSNVGADNLAEGFLKLGLKVVRVGKPSAVSEHLWDFTLEAAIDRDPQAQKALKEAARATALLANIKRRSKKSKKNEAISEKMAQDVATAAVKESIRASNIAATAALRAADIIVSTSTGAADPRLLSACGMDFAVEENSAANRAISSQKQKLGLNGLKPTSTDRGNAPDGLPPLSLPFVIVDEACQSVEPATLIPLTASNSCRSLVLLGDPCQLPATVKSDPDSVLGVSLMERLAATLPAPMINMKDDNTALDSSYIDDLPIKQARSLMLYREKGIHRTAYRKQFAGALLLGIQYRMHPSIAAFSSAMFYDSRLVTPHVIGAARTIPASLHELMPCGNPQLGVRLINVGGRCNESRGDQSKFTNPAVGEISNTSLESTTFANEAEAVRVVSLIKGILRKYDVDDPSSPRTIGVVTPYTGQVRLIKSMIANESEIVAKARGLAVSIEVKSVDGYQGRERDIIIFSAVRSNRRGNVGFLQDWRRLNVALTRARNALLVIGDADTLFEGDTHWASFIKWCHGVRCVVDDTENPEECDSL